MTMPARCSVAMLVAVVAALLFVPSAPAAVKARGFQLHSLWYSSSRADMDRELDLAAGAGSNVVRVDVAWSSLETDGRGNLTSSYRARLDAFMEGAGQRGMKVVVVLHSTPCWASSAPESAKAGCEGEWWNRGVAEYAPRNNADYARIANWITSQYGSRMAALEIWNEPNNEDFWRASDPLEAYVDLVKAAYPAAKRGDPDVPVIAGSTSFADRPWIEGMYERGVAPYEDGIAVHPYNEWRAPGDLWQVEWRQYTLIPGLRWVRDAMIAHGDADKRIWITEFGWSSCANSTSTWCVTETEQATYLEDSFPLLDAEAYVHAAIIYNLRNKGEDLADRESQFGVLRADFTAKPAYAGVVRAFARYPLSEAAIFGSRWGSPFDVPDVLRHYRTHGRRAALTPRRARSAARRAIARRVGPAWRRRAKGHQLTCTTQSRRRARCLVQWRRGEVRYAGTVTITRRDGTERVQLKLRRGSA